MAFWGVEVKPGKPYTHTYQADHGRLRVCQATLSNCDVSGRTVLQCNVGNKIPIKLCSLNPRLAEMCHLEIELEEVDDVVFSVIGQSSIHLSGYYVRASSRSNAGDDESYPSQYYHVLFNISNCEIILNVVIRESYGEDIGQSDTDEEHDANEDSYESDFIDDRDVIDVSDDECSSPRRRKQASGKQTRKAERRRRLKKHQVDSTDDDDSPVMKPAVKHNARAIFDSGSDEDNVPISVALSKKDSAKVAVKHDAPSIFDSCSDEEDNDVTLSKKDSTKVSEETNLQNGQTNDGTKKNSDDKKRKSSAISEDPASSMDIEDANAPSVSKQGSDIKKKSKKKMKKQSGGKDEKQSNIRTLDDGLMVEDLSTGNIDAKVASDGCKVYIKYVGMLKEGKIVESNLSEKPYKFKLGAGKVIRGWDVGIRGNYLSA
ncbi:peptidyl-prolyl cis-trans isomerase FKBP43-like [Panicum miliaceum]|uniref:peptidylprolyl isomerase n=1 Tax=Panicum miliaceum TaxID=4540 RepID=A0A3L6QNI1_PANMI|nr:peptidyl-prolyl cis-trans isomerase FKBP43-like [Panicum miliaceum]